MKKMRSAKQVRTVNNILVHTALAILAAVWVFPILWVILTSFRAEKGSYVSTFFPKAFTLANYSRLFTDTTILNFPRMFANTLFIAVCSCILSTFYVLAVSYCLSRLKFRMRKPYMNMAMILGLFPGFMSMVAGVFHLKGTGADRGESDSSGAHSLLFGRRRPDVPDRQGLLRHGSEGDRRGCLNRRLQPLADLFTDYTAAQQADYYLHGTDILHCTVGGFYLRKGDLPG